MNPSPAAITLIRSQVSDWTQTNDAIATSLNTANIANPTPQGSVANPISESTLLGQLSQASINSLLGWINFGLVKTDIDSGNRTGLLLWVPLLEALALITPTEATTLNTYLQGTTADSSWQATVSWSQVNLGRAVDSLDIAASRP